MYCEKCGIHYAVEMRDGQWLCGHCIAKRNEPSEDNNDN